MQATRSVRRLSLLSSHLEAKKYDYDLIVVGGGSGGLACSKEAALLGKRVAVLDYVHPSPQGSTWGLGGTCVNVGCIPKKLMHHAALLGQAIKDSRHYGWTVPEHVTHSWSLLRSAVNDHVKSLNWGHRVQLKEKNVDYINATGYFIDSHTLEATTAEGKSRLSAECFVVAVGGRPHLPSDVPGASEYGITSDDLFFLEKPPGKTLVVGAGYVALECAGFIAGLGFDTSLMIRSVPLKSFDQDVVCHVTAQLEGEEKVKLLRHCQPREVKRREKGGRVEVEWYNSHDSQLIKDEWDTVIFATGRQACTYGLGLADLGVQVNPMNSKIVTDEQDSTHCGSVFAIGDVADTGLELTPVAVKAGRLLAQRLFSNSKHLVDYNLVPTTVFTPLELSAVGLTEAQAVAKYGSHNIEVYHAFYTPLEYYLPQRSIGLCYIKMICLKTGDEEMVLGLHLTGPSAGEVAQGFSVAMRRGLSRADLASSVGIHPTCAEEIVKLNITKSSGKDPHTTGC